MMFFKSETEHRQMASAGIIKVAKINNCCLTFSQHSHSLKDGNWINIGNIPSHHDIKGVDIYIQTRVTFTNITN